MGSRRLLKLILAGVFVSGATLCWNLQRDLPKDPPASVIHRGSKALAMPLQGDSRGTNVDEAKPSQSEIIASTSNALTSNIPLVALVSCQDRAPLTIVTLKSALMMSRRPLRFVIFADRENAKELNTQISRFPRRVRARANISIQPVEFPASARESQAIGIAKRAGGPLSGQGQPIPDVGSEWRQLFKPCSAQRLFLPDLLKNEDAVLYVDTDTVFLGAVEQLWDHFGKMNESHIAAAIAESEDDKSGWYPRLARHPYVHPRGVNSGVMLLNLTRLRAFDWSQRVTSVYEQWRERVVWGDQDIINIVFSNHSDSVYILPCEWNFRPDHCQYSSPCRGANRQGPGLLHGSRAVFTNNKQPAFRAIFKAFQQFSFRRRNRRGTRPKPGQKPTKSNSSMGAVGARHPIVTYRDRRQLSVNLLPRAHETARGGQDSSDVERVQHDSMMANVHEIPDREQGGKERLKLNKERMLASAGSDYTLEVEGNTRGRQLKSNKNNDDVDLRENQVAVAEDGEDDDDDDELSLKERLISPLTIGIFETVNTRCGRFLKAHTKRLTRALYARARDL